MVPARILNFGQSVFVRVECDGTMASLLHRRFGKENCFSLIDYITLNRAEEGAPALQTEADTVEYTTLLSSIIVCRPNPDSFKPLQRFDISASQAQVLDQVITVRWCLTITIIITIALAISLPLQAPTNGHSGCNTLGWVRA